VLYVSIIILFADKKKYSINLETKLSFINIGIFILLNGIYYRFIRNIQFNNISVSKYGVFINE
jgi:hypothetical protein